MSNHKMSQALGAMLRRAPSEELKRLRAASIATEERTLMVEAARAVRAVLERQGNAAVDAVEELGGELFRRLRWLAGAPANELRRRGVDHRRDRVPRRGARDARARDAEHARP